MTALGAETPGGRGRGRQTPSAVSVPQFSFWNRPFPELPPYTDRSLPHQVNLKPFHPRSLAAHQEIAKSTQRFRCEQTLKPLPDIFPLETHLHVPTILDESEGIYSPRQGQSGGSAGVFPLFLESGRCNFWALSLQGTGPPGKGQSRASV